MASLSPVATLNGVVVEEGVRGDGNVELNQAASELKPLERPTVGNVGKIEHCPFQYRVFRHRMRHRNPNYLDQIRFTVSASTSSCADTTRAFA